MHLLCLNWDSTAIRSCPIPLNSTMSHTEGTADTLSLSGFTAYFSSFFNCSPCQGGVCGLLLLLPLSCVQFPSPLRFTHFNPQTCWIWIGDTFAFTLVSVWSKRIPGHHFKCILSCTFVWSGTNCWQSKHIKLTLLPGEKRNYKDHM